VARLNRPVRAHEECDIRFRVELLWYTPEEFARKRAEVRIVRTAVAEGVDLLGAGAAEAATAGGMGGRGCAGRMMRGLLAAIAQILGSAVAIIVVVTR